jgi:hypothetical protein
MPHKVSLFRLKLTDFRNYAAAALALDGRHVVLTGDNGAGKTNLMEAVSFLSPGRGLRRATYGDVTRVGADAGFSIFAELDGMEGEVEIGTGVDTTDETTARKLRINGTTAKTTDELTDHLRVLWLTPAMDGLFTGGSIAGVFSTGWCSRSIPRMAAGPAISSARCAAATSCSMNAASIPPGSPASNSRWQASASPWRLPGRKCSACSPA